MTIKVRYLNMSSGKITDKPRTFTPKRNKKRHKVRRTRAIDYRSYFSALKTHRDMDEAYKLAMELDS